VKFPIQRTLTKEIIQLSIFEQEQGAALAD